REVGKQSLRRGFAYIFGNVQNYGDGPQGFCHAAYAGRFLADQAVPPSEIFIPAARWHHANAQLGDNVGRARDTLALVSGKCHFEWLAFGSDHALGEAADDVQALAVNIHQPEFFDWQAVYARQKTVDKLGGIGRTSPDDCDLHRELSFNF